MNEYEKLTQYINNNLLKQDISEITFEYLTNLDENLHEFPIEKLMSIKSDKTFIYEIYYKMLNRMIDIPTLNRLINILKNGNKETRMKILKDVYNSKERKIKKTELVFNKEYTI